MTQKNNNKTIPTKGVVVLGSKDCNPCQILKNILNKHQVSYNYIDVIEKKIPVRTIPQTYKDGQFKFAGVPSPYEIRKLLKE